MDWGERRVALECETFDQEREAFLFQTLTVKNGK